MFNDYQHLQQHKLNTREQQGKAKQVRANRKHPNKRTRKKG